MYKVNNKKAVRNIAVKSFLANKTRNIIAIIAITLTALLFTSVATIGLSLIDTVQYFYMRQVGTSLHAGYKYLTQDFYEKVANDDKLSDMDYRIIIGALDNKELAKLHTEMSYVDEKYVESSFIQPITGAMPTEKNEVLVADSILNAMGLPEEIGEEITLEFRANGIDYEETFIVSGIYEVDPALTVSHVFTSYDYAVSVAPLWTGDDVLSYFEKMSDDFSFIAGSVMTNFNFSTSFDIAGQMDALNGRMGFDMTLVDSGINWGYMSSEVDITLVILLTTLILIITSSGYLIIYNIFLISVSNDVKFYGLLKTIGTTSKQLKKIVRMQALILSAIGIPLGLIAGYFVGAQLMPAVMGMSTFNDFVVSMNPLIFIVATVFSLITVQISCNKPCKFISKLSPIEAVRHTSTGKKMKHTRKAKKVTTLFMALANIKRNKLKTTLVIISISLSALIFNITYTFVAGLDMDEYLSRFVIDDFLVSSTDILNMGGEHTLDGVSDEFINEVFTLGGVLDIGKTYVLNSTHILSEPAKENVVNALEKYNDENSENSIYMDGVLDMLDKNEIYTFIYGVSENLMDKLVTESSDIIGTNYLTQEQIELFKTGDYVLTTGYYGASLPDEIYYGKGDTVMIDFGSGNVQEYEVLDAGVLPYALGPRFSVPIDVQFILPESEFLAQLPDRNALNITIRANEENVPEIEAFIANYTENIDPLIDYESKALFMQEFNDLKSTFSMTGYTLSFILGFIGIINFINTMITSVSSRKLELAMLQSLGLTGKQLKKTLVYEGMFYGVFVVGFLATIGSLITYYLVNMLSTSIIASNYSFELLPLIVISLLLGVISFITPLIIYHHVKSKSVVERLREIG